MDDKRPNFMLLGAAKSGTSSLAYYLSQHPQVYVSEPKEPRFFELEYTRGMAYYWSTYFQGWAGEPRIGDANPTNLFLPYVPARIKAELPHAQLLVILRNPVDRAFSDWWMRYSLNVESLPFESAIESNIAQRDAGFIIEEIDEARWREVKHWGQNPPAVRFRWYLEQGYYAQQIQRYLECYPRSSLKVLRFEDLARSPENLMRDVWAFLEVNPDFELLSAAPKMSALPTAARPLLRIARAFRLHGMVPQGMRDWLGNLLPRVSKKPVLSSAMRARLLDYYAPRNRELEQLLGMDFSRWNR